MLPAIGLAAAALPSRAKAQGARTMPVANVYWHRCPTGVGSAGIWEEIDETLTQSGSFFEGLAASASGKTLCWGAGIGMSPLGYDEETGDMAIGIIHGGSIWTFCHNIVKTRDWR